MAPLLLPTPLAVDTLDLGQITCNPLDPISPHFLSPKPARRISQVQPNYQSVIAHDDHGRFAFSLDGQSLPSCDNLLYVNADQMEYQSLDQPKLSFDTLRTDPDARNYFLQMAERDRPLYYVTGLQKLRNPTFKLSVVNKISITEAKDDRTLPLHTRRDSAMDIRDNERVSGVEVLKVKCHVGSPSEPHTPDDIYYNWTYHSLDADGNRQLSIGLGKPMTPKELRALAGMADEEEDISYESYDEDEEEEAGAAGFSAHRGRRMW